MGILIGDLARDVEGIGERMVVGMGVATLGRPPGPPNKIGVLVDVVVDVLGMGAVPTPIPVKSPLFAIATLSLNMLSLSTMSESGSQKSSSFTMCCGEGESIRLNFYIF